MSGRGAHNRTGPVRGSSRSTVIFSSNAGSSPGPAACVPGCSWSGGAPLRTGRTSHDGVRASGSSCLPCGRALVLTSSRAALRLAWEMGQNAHPLLLSWGMGAGLAYHVVALPVSAASASVFTGPGEGLVSLIVLVSLQPQLHHRTFPPVILAVHPEARVQPPLSPLLLLTLPWEGQGPWGHSSIGRAPMLSLSQEPQRNGRTSQEGLHVEQTHLSQGPPARISAGGPAPLLVSLAV